MFFDKENYDLFSETELDLLLADLPVELLKENVRKQINDPFYNSVNYLFIVTNKVIILRDQFSEDEDMIDKINDFLVSFLNFFIEEIDERFNLCLDIDPSKVDEFTETAFILYEFFIINYRKNVSNFLYKYILKNKKIIAEGIESKKDVSTSSLKKKIKNKDDVVIIANLPTILKQILYLDIDPEEFINYLCQDLNYDSLYIKDLITENKLNGNFVDKFFEPLIDNSYGFDEVLNDVKVKYLFKS